ncbi:uncharacterized protein CIMG_07853 [Coccidioides immitis RS]|uniref:Uncharacterized protein n=1 Tax=Coccidioides immitis (strain RS) TaxID=246410 RepID=A0A0E1RWH3_COCIM|nr:uncharacterized protein CIMG_07853 [Coccidioides immitis RS]EAS29107.2 hypothetical protein CIMG_07853 [Coccidioides immitis RS]
MVEIHIAVLLPKAQLRLPRADGTEDCTIRDRPLANKEEDPLEKEEDSDFDFWVMGEKSMGGVERTRGREGRAKRRVVFYVALPGQTKGDGRKPAEGQIWIKQILTDMHQNPRSSETFDIIQLAFTPWTGCY